MKRNILRLTTWEKYEKKLLKDKKFQKRARELEYEYILAKNIIDLRRKKGLSQDELASLAGTKQPVISRVETARTKPTLSMLERIANALGAKLEVSLS